ncbi:uncharacterized protein LOC134561801 isoform X1 [Prinia subflava]|uniref:uncharacterized protein LOC134561801 isoform X1 n=1 Tax=Prinia subflava TaxID=208062 RepID=UPI002FE16FCE
MAEQPRGRPRGGFGEQECPAGAQGCGVDQHRGALGFNFLPGAEPISSGITCGVWGWDSPARLGSARPRGSPTAAELPAPARMEPTKLPLTKRMAPAPPVPAKTKPAPVLATKPSEPQPSASADMEGGRASDPDANGFDTVAVTTARLSHPTATRPRVPGQRPPSIALGSTGGPRGGEQPQGLPRAALCAPVPSTRQVPVLPWSTEGLEVLEGRSLALEDLKAEVRTLHILVDLMRVQHLRDLQDLRQELCQERVQRQALQVSPWQGLPCPGVPCAPQQSQPLPTGGDRASEEGAALLARGAVEPTHGTGQVGGTWFCAPQLCCPQPSSAPIRYKCPAHTQTLLLEA